jgi:predicted NBD/HSP70 family sugar kinase
VENDSRAKTYGEYICGVAQNKKNMLFLNVTWGLGMGMVIDGKLSYGKSGFSGEIGHFPLLNNDQICHCGKTGCLETGASGSAAHRIMLEKLHEGRSSVLTDKYQKCEEITLDDILNAVREEDVLAIEVIEEIGTNLGRAIAGLINIFNPELVVIGGKLASVQDYLMLPIKSAVQKHSLNMINRDTTIKLSRLGAKGGAIGACMLSRSKLLGLM